MRESLLLLKTAPPRPNRVAATRPRLEHRWAEISDRTAILLTAAQGFGKTTLMAQWRRNWLARGAYVAWAALDEQDEGARLVDLLLFALREATGRDSFARTAVQVRLQAHRELDALTELLAEVALLATQTIVISTTRIACRSRRCASAWPISSTTRRPTCSSSSVRAGRSNCRSPICWRRAGSPHSTNATCAWVSMKRSPCCAPASVHGSDWMTPSACTMSPRAGRSACSSRRRRSKKPSTCTKPSGA